MMGGSLSMAMVDHINGHNAAIADALSRELQRQGISGVDIEALAAAVADALEREAPPSEGKRPEELNATNDD